jgi:hypothetical protein
LLIEVFDGYAFFIVVMAAIAVVTDVWSVIAAFLAVSACV